MIFAVWLLALDGVMLLIAGAVLRATLPTLGGMACLLAAALVAVSWRSHRRRVEELRAARQEVQEEVRALRALVARKDR
jgi:hypothetical protein